MLSLVSLTWAEDERGSWFRVCGCNSRNPLPPALSTLGWSPLRDVTETFSMFPTMSSGELVSERGEGYRTGEVCGGVEECLVRGLAANRIHS